MNSHNLLLVIGTLGMALVLVALNAFFVATELAIDAHPDALHETVVLVIDSATAAGMQKIRIVARAVGAD